MKLDEMAVKTGKTLGKAFHGVGRFAKLERVLAAVCVTTPFLLWWIDSGPLRNSISAYYEMEESQFFYVPLTVAAMLFVVNGVIKEQHIYNTFLGGFLAGVLLFDHSDFTAVHAVFASLFFAGNAFVILAFSRTERWLKMTFIAAIVLSVGGYFLFDSFTLFWAETLSLAAIAAHYILDSLKDRRNFRYQAA